MWHRLPSGNYAELCYQLVIMLYYAFCVNYANYAKASDAQPKIRPHKTYTVYALCGLKSDRWKCPLWGVGPLIRRHLLNKCRAATSVRRVTYQTLFYWGDDAIIGRRATDHVSMPEHARTWTCSRDPSPCAL